MVVVEHPFNSISAISEQQEGDYDALCVEKCCLGLDSIACPSGS